MKKKLFLVFAMAALFVCLLAIGVSAETPSNYIEFGARFPDSDNYITVYTENAESTSHPHINFATKKFYSDVDFTQEVDMSTATGIDFSVTKTYVNGEQGVAPNRMTKPLSPFVNCVEVKWFLDGFPTVSYNGSFFKGWTGLKSFDFGNATAIADNTFEGCGLESIIIPATVTSFGGSAFKDCVSLKTVKIEGNITKFGNGSTFYGCTALETVDLGTPAYIGKSMFYGCTSLSSLTVPSSATYIGESAFYDCKNLSSIELPSTITEIKGSAFHSCTSLTSINIPEGVTKLGNYALYNTGVKTIHIPSTVESIGYQFAEKSAVETLTFAENSSLTFIDHRAFRDCDSLVGPVILPYGLIEMDYGVFDNCAMLKAVKMPDTLTTLSGDAALFNSCPSLEYVQFSKNLTGTIYKSMFENCTSLKAISFPDGVTKIDYKALRNCTSLEAVYLPSGLEELGSVNTGASDWGVFYQSSKVYLVNEPFNVFDGDKLVENFVMPQKPEVYYMPSGMTALGNSAFQNCSNLNKYIVFPTGITSVGECSQGAFFKASSSTNPVTFVFLGDMTSIRIRQNDNASSNMSFIFANPNDTGITSMEFIIGSANNAYMTNTYAYFCASNTVYDLSTFKAANATVYTVTEDDYTKTVNTAETQPHFRSPRNDQKTPATCVTPELSLTFCFCGTPMGTQETAPALGHAKDLEADEMWNYGGNYYQ